MSEERLLPSVDIQSHLKLIQVAPLPVIEEIWEHWEGGKNGLLAFNDRAKLGIDHYYAILMTSGDGPTAEQFTLNSAVFDKNTSFGYDELKELLAVQQQAVMNKIFPMTCFSS